MKMLYEWARKKIQSPYATYILALLLIIEGFFLMPANTLLMIYGIERPRHIFFYATIAIIASIAGGIIAYGLGLLLWYAGGKTIMYWLIGQDGFDSAALHYRDNQIWAVFTGSLLPIPYKFITLTAGFFQISFLPFVLCIAIARTIRFYLVATALYLFGPTIQELIDRYFYIFVALTIAIIIASIWKIRQ